MRWAIRYRMPSGETALLPGRHDSSAEAHLRAAELRALDNGRTYRVARLVTRSERLQRELDEARAERDAARATAVWQVVRETAAILATWIARGAR